MGVLDKVLGLRLSPIKELWQDREVRFGCSKRELTLKEGEIILGTVADVEDTKAHNGVAGKLLITNLRLMWWSKKALVSGLSIGYGCFSRILAKLSSSKLKGATESLHISAKHQDRDYNFVFTSLKNTAFQVYSGVAHVYSIYDKTRLYRDVSLGGAFLIDGDLDKLAFEQTDSKVDGVWNLCGGEGDVGTLFVSNIRVVWSSSTRPSFNISLPYNQVHDVKVRPTKLGSSLQLESSKNSGAYAWIFKVEPKETLDFLYKQIVSQWRAHTEEPFYGIDTQVQTEACTEALAAEPSGFSFTSRSENMRSMDSESRANLVETYFAHTSTSPGNSFTNQGLESPRASFTSPPASPLRASSNSFTAPPRSPRRPLEGPLTLRSSASAAPASPERPSSHSFSGPVPRPPRRSSANAGLRPTASSFTQKTRNSATSFTNMAHDTALAFAHKARDSASSKATVESRELVYWCNPLALGLSPTELRAEQI
ncbi:hypothetical protein DUNSADRAFT_17683 [Dunaliella salina]|uniref:BBSome complex member BBS5 PH domain-containing protein n=1 Tax=Dunaliella salina TaxID=3046 RepID=A0ABQ7G1A2_DUNSA|nr:hypothetical protein DUNSADRAFT_17683 [Dunaliella salina]|eukprot:KAF5828381.1 hypothetical protein DUNSADRAFT_17683 [Dunaliella salina]